MKFTIYKSVFLKSLTSVGRAASTHSPLPILSGIKLSAHQDGLTLLASDSNITIKETILVNDESKLEIDKYGDVVLDARYILEAVRKLDSMYVNFEIIDGSLIRISGNNAEYMINGSSANNYPNIDLKKPEVSFDMSAKELKELIVQTSFACATSEERPIFTGVNFSLDGNTLTCVATNSYRLARKVMTINTEGNFNITVPSYNLNEVEKSLNNDVDVTIAVSNKIIQFYIDGTLIQSRLVDGLYPNIDRLIPTEFAYELLVNASDLISTIDRSSFLKTDGFWNVRLEANNDGVTISSRSQEIGSSTESFTPLDYRGGNLRISFSGAYMIEALKSFRTEVLRISFVGEMQGFIVRKEDDESTVQLILPVRTFD